jgi:sulfatase modifying factor 1
VHEESGLTFVLIPETGKDGFRMGSLGGDDDERPIRDVTVPAFLLSQTECTQEAWAKGTVKASKKPHYAGSAHPVEMVSGNESDAWCRGFRAKLRLPTEAEWEYAGRAGTTTLYSFGDEWDPSKCMAENNEENTEAKGLEYYRTHGLPMNATAPVGSFPPSPWGLFDMHGNVWEWCADWYVKYEDAPRDGSPGTRRGGLGRASRRVYRGGGWDGSASWCRSANRTRDFPIRRWTSLGFRPAASLPR